MNNNNDNRILTIPELLDATRLTIRRLNYSPNTRDVYLHWIEGFIRFHKNRHPGAMGAHEIVLYLNHLVDVGNVAASTQNQALCALVFLYKRVLGREPGEFENLERAQRPEHLPVVLSPIEARVLLDRLEHPFHLIGGLQYGSGLRLLESLNLRVKDLDFDRHQIMVRRGKGDVDRVSLLPECVHEGLLRQVDAVTRRHQAARKAGRGEVWLPTALARK